MHIRKGQELINKLKNINLFKDWSVPYNKPLSTYKNLVCITGFGYSGSGAVIDYLSEFSNTTILGHHDMAFSQAGKGIEENQNLEIGFICDLGGIMWLENEIINSSNFLHKDYAVKLFLHIAENCYRLGGMYNDEYWKLTLEFVDKLVDYKIPFPGFLKQLNFNYSGKKFANIGSELCKNVRHRMKYIYYLKPLTIDEYRKIAKEYIISFLKTINSKDFLVLDHVLSSSVSELQRKSDYVGDYKFICSYRDPRDVYAQGFRDKLNCIPKDTETFIKWFRNNGIKTYIDDDYKNKLIIRFEDFVLNYEETSEKINGFLQLDEINHTKRKEYFVPEYSKQNIGIYKNFENQSAIKYIEKELPEFLYIGLGGG